MFASSPSAVVSKAGSSSSSSSQGSSAISLPKYGLSGELLNHRNSGGLQVDYAFSRDSSLYSRAMNAVALTFANRKDFNLQFIRCSDAVIESGMEFRGFDVIPNLNPMSTAEQKIHILFAGKLEPVSFQIWNGDYQYKVTLAPTIGELIRPSFISTAQFSALQKRLAGMTESSFDMNMSDVTSIGTRMVTHFNAALLPDDDQKDDKKTYRFAAEQLKDDQPFLIEVSTSAQRGSGQVSVVVSTSDFIYTSIAADLVRKALSE
eukprot:TRINITY_DN5185_c0_g1_i4.p1 TRINITY_DN5185_c0_g1~~TRINITY_DN5185_c0_g1_i4.p1  ORF type:complete len:262 (-),score=61.20 TRINITY_DN5185_c0_g1_i4:60-845(-)